MDIDFRKTMERNSNQPDMISEVSENAMENTHKFIVQELSGWRFS